MNSVPPTGAIPELGDSGDFQISQHIGVSDDLARDKLALQRELAMVQAERDHLAQENFALQDQLTANRVELGRQAYQIEQNSVEIASLREALANEAENGLCCCCRERRG